MVELKDFAVENYYGFMAPAAIPKDVLAKLQADVKQVMALPEVKQRFSNAGLDLFVRGPEQMTAVLKGDIETFKKAIDIAGIKPE
jgi:tripartite-type tricarboxylate transporter receptor subunit TctC